MKVYLKNISAFDYKKSSPLPEVIEEKIKNAKNEERKREIYAGYIMLISCAKEYNINFAEVKYKANNKPYISENFEFNLSHSENKIAIVFGEYECGIDMQKISDYKINIANKYFSKKEISSIEKSDEKERLFTLVWSIREAYFKMTGEGINRNEKLDFSEFLSETMPIKFCCYNACFYVDMVDDNILCVCTKYSENEEQVLEVCNMDKFKNAIKLSKLPEKEEELSEKVNIMLDYVKDIPDINFETKRNVMSKLRKDISKGI